MFFWNFNCLCLFMLLKNKQITDIQECGGYWRMWDFWKKDNDFFIIIVFCFGPFLHFTNVWGKQNGQRPSWMLKNNNLQSYFLRLIECIAMKTKSTKSNLLSTYQTQFIINRLAIQTLFQHSRLAPIHVWNAHFSSSNLFLMGEIKSSPTFFPIKYPVLYKLVNHNNDGNKPEGKCILRWFQHILYLHPFRRSFPNNHHRNVCRNH